MPQSLNLKAIGIIGLCISLTVSGCAEEGSKKTQHERVQGHLTKRLTSYLNRLDRDLAFLNGRALITPGLLTPEDAACGDGELVKPGDSADCQPSALVKPLDVHLAADGSDIIKRLHAALDETAVEAQDNTHIVYRLTADALCGEQNEALLAVAARPQPRTAPVAGPQPSAGAEAQRDATDSPATVSPWGFGSPAACRQAVERFEPRVVVSADDDDLNFDIMFSSQRVRTARVVLGPDRAVLTVDLAALRQAVTYISDQDGQKQDPIEAMEGVIRVRLETGETGHPELTVHIDQPVDVHVTGQDAGQLTIGAVSPLLTIGADTDRRRVHARLSAGAISALMPFVHRRGMSMISTDSPGDGRIGNAADAVQRTLGISLSGIDLGLSMTVGETIQRTLTFGLGPKTSTVAVDGASVISVDVNPKNGRRLQLDLDDATTRGDLLELAFAEAAMAVTIATDFTQLEDASVPEWIRRDVFSFDLEALSDSLPTIILGADTMRVIDGRLTIKAEAARIKHVIESGQCLDVPESAGGEIPDEGVQSHPWSDLTVGFCQ